MFLVFGVVTRSPEPLPAFRAAEPVVVAFAIEDVSTTQASDACGNFSADELGVQPRVVAVQP
jgi:hypothetical protein